MRVGLFLSLLWLCSCTQERPPELTGEWLRTQPDIVYYFGDDSRFWQSDRIGEQWIWKRDNDLVRLLGQPERLWIISFQGPDNLRVIESDTFDLRRK